MRYYQFLPLAISTFLWVDCRHLRDLTANKASIYWANLLRRPIRIFVIIGAKFFGILAFAWFLIGLGEIGFGYTTLTAFIAFALAECVNYPLTLLVRE
jgi:hypothetical protein